MPNNAHKRYRKIEKKNLDNIAVSIMRDETERKNELKCDEDTIIRTEIHGIIALGIKEGKDKTDIINELSENSRYEKYSMYFERWITDKMKKVQNREERQK